MKVILTGSTGFIGGEVLEQCLQASSITSIVALCRRELPSEITTAHPKLKVVIMDDFTSYPDHVLQEIKGANACIWSLGKASVSSVDEARKMTLDYTLAAVKAMQQTLKPEDGKKFRFVYLSGKIVERDQTKPLWFMQEPRRIRGLLETELITFAESHADTFETYITKPSMVLSKGSTLMSLALGSIMPTVKVDILAETMIKIAINGHNQQTLENSDIVQFGS